MNVNKESNKSNEYGDLKISDNFDKGSVTVDGKTYNFQTPKNLEGDVLDKLHSILKSDFQSGKDTQTIHGFTFTLQKSLITKAGNFFSSIFKQSFSSLSQDDDLNKPIQKSERKEPVKKIDPEVKTEKSEKKEPVKEIDPEVKKEKIQKIKNKILPSIKCSEIDNIDMAIQKKNDKIKWYQEEIVISPYLQVMYENDIEELKSEIEDYKKEKDEILEKYDNSINWIAEKLLSDLISKNDPYKLSYIKHEGDVEISYEVKGRNAIQELRDLVK